MEFIDQIKDKAKEAKKRIVLPETDDARVIEAARAIIEQGIAQVVLLKGNIPPDLEEKAIVIDPENFGRSDEYVKELVAIRKDKGIDEGKAKEILKDPNYFATMLVHMGDADGLVSGATHTTADTIRPALQIIKTEEKFHKVSSFFFMIVDGRVLLFADCAINIDPDAKDLAKIAIDTARSARKFGIEPRVAMLSFSTHGSAKHPFADKVKESVALAKHEKPDLIIDGEMQVDAALVKEVCKSKCKECVLEGDANVLIFPDLQSGNIAYKLVERLAGANAIGPILQGLKKPVNDLSRGCSVEDIINVVAITAVEAR